MKHDGGQCALAALVFAGGVAATAPLFLLMARIPDLARVYREVGVALPALLELVIALRLDLIAVPATLLLPIGVLVLGRAKPAAGRVVGYLALALVLGALFLTVGAHAALAAATRQMFLRDGGDEPPPVVGRAAKLAEEVVAAFDRSVKTRAGRASGRIYAIFDGPGVRDVPAGVPPYEKALGSDACILLPWAPEGNTNLAAEPHSTYPSPEGSDRSPASLARDRVADDLAPARLAPSEHGTLVPRITRVFDAGDGFSYVLHVRRARVRANPEEVDRPASAGGAFVDDAYVVRVAVFRGFDPAAASADPIPRRNLPVAELLTVVRR